MSTPQETKELPIPRLNVLASDIVDMIEDNATRLVLTELLNGFIFSGAQVQELGSVVNSLHKRIAELEAKCCQVDPAFCHSLSFAAIRDIIMK